MKAFIAILTFGIIAGGLFMYLLGKKRLHECNRCGALHNAIGERMEPTPDVYTGPDGLEYPERICDDCKYSLFLKFKSSVKPTNRND